MATLRSIYHLPETPGPLLLLAPMAGYTDAAMRMVCHRCGAALAYTEMANAYGLAHEGQKTWHLMETFADEGPVVAHIYGNDPAMLAEAAALVERSGRFVGVDLNAGCPVHKVTASGAGSALIHKPELIHDILAAMVKATKLPVTIKTRLGPAPDKVAIFEILDAAERAGAAAITVHGRFTSQHHSGPVHLDLLAEVKRRASIPVIANGSIVSPTTAWNTFHETSCDALMIARAAIGNPWIFQEIAKAWNPDGAPVAEPPPVSGRSRRDLDEIRSVLLLHLDAEKRLLTLIREKYDLPQSALTPEEALVATFRCHFFRYLHGLQGSGYVRRILSAIRTEADVRGAIEQCLANEAAFRAGKPCGEMVNSRP
jgi:tRNA-dihydrouridine synthase B